MVPSHGFLAFSLSWLKRSRSLGCRLVQTLAHCLWCWYCFWWQLALWHFVRPGCKLKGILTMNWSTASNYGFKTLIHNICKKGPTSSTVADSITTAAIISAPMHTLGANYLTPVDIGDLLDGQISCIIVWVAGSPRKNTAKHIISTEFKISKIPLYFSISSASRYEGPIGSTEVWRTTSCSHFWYLS